MVDTRVPPPSAVDLRQRKLPDVREAFRLRPGAPAIGTGPNGLDMGALVPAGASISGEPASPTDRTEAVLRIGGPGIVAFRYRVNDGPYSAETPIADLLAGETVRLSNLRDGRYTVYVVGKKFGGRLSRPGHSDGFS